MFEQNKTASRSAAWVVVAVVGWAFVPAASALAQRAGSVPPQPTGAEAMRNAAEANETLFLFCWKEDDANTKRMYQTLQAGLKEMGAGVTSASANVADPRQKGIVEKFGLDRAPMPLVLAIAPNGAITGGWPIQMSKEQMRGAIVSETEMQALKALQARKLVLLCLYHPNGENRLPEFHGARDFKSDSPYGPATEMVMANIEEDGNARFLKRLRIEPSKTPDSFLLLAPPGNLVAQFASNATKDEIVAKLKAAQSNPCAGGQCGPGGCGPKQ